MKERAVNGDPRLTSFSESEVALNWPLSRIGVKTGDVITLVTPAVDAHYQIGGTP